MLIAMDHLKDKMEELSTSGVDKKTKAIAIWWLSQNSLR